MYQGHLQGKGERAVAMVLKELPGKKASSSQGHALFTVTTKVAGEQQESRPLLSPSIDDFLSESRIDGPVARPVTSNTAGHPASLLTTSNTAVLSTALDLVDLSEPCPSPGGLSPGGRGSRKGSVRARRSPAPSFRRGAAKTASPRRGRADDTELIQAEAECSSPSPRTPERVSLDSVGLSASPPEKWEEVNLHPDTPSAGRKRPCERRSAEFKTDPSTRTSFEVNSVDDITYLSAQDCCVSREHRLGRGFLARNQSLDEEFVKAKAAVESDTEFWDKIEAEMEELARRNWLEDEEHEGPIPPTVCPIEKGYYFHANNPYQDLANAFEEGQMKAREGDLNSAVLLLEAAILQDPHDSEAWQVLGTTQAENENEQAAIVSLQRCLQLHPKNLAALLALAVSLTNAGLQQDACEALQRWISHNPRYKHLELGASSLGSPAPPRRGPSTPTQGSGQLAEVKALFQNASLLNTAEDGIDPDLQTGLGVLFNLSSEFDKAVQAFHAALSVTPQDYLLWNRLGATLANGDRSAEAVEAYSRALELQPGFIRSRYNLGISCINLGAHREAASNFLTALSQQRQSDRQSHQVMSANIWAALRIAVSMLDRPELFHAASIGDLDLLLRAFHTGPK